MIDISFKNKTGLKPVYLSAVIGADSFFYGLLDEDNKLIESILYPNIDFSSQEDFDKVNNELFELKGIEHIKVSFTVKPFLHASKEDAGQLSKYFPAFNNKIKDQDRLIDQEVYVDYGLTKSQKSFCDKLFSEGYEVFHISAVLANSLYPFRNKQVLAFIETNTIHIVYGENLNFYYYNQFHCENENDYLYFLLKVYDELKLDKETTSLQLSGRVEADSPIYKNIYSYIKTIELFKTEYFKVADLRYKNKQHFYHDLFATKLCV